MVIDHQAGLTSLRSSSYGDPVALAKAEDPPLRCGIFARRPPLASSSCGKVVDMPRPAAIALPIGLAVAAPVVATDWPQVLGPQRNGTYSGPPLAEAWAHRDRRSSGATSRSGVCRTCPRPESGAALHRIGNEEVLESLDAKTGAPVWR